MGEEQGIYYLGMEMFIHMVKVRLNKVLMVFRDARVDWKWKHRVQDKTSGKSYRI